MAQNNSPVTDNSCSQQQTTQVDIERIREKRLAQLLSTNLVLDPSSTCHRALVTHPGLPPHAIDRFGNPSVVSLVWVARMARQVAMQARGQDGRVFLEMDRLREGHLTFMAAAHYTINSCAYQPEERKFPLHVLLEVGHVGRTSFSVISTVTLPSGDVMLTAVNQMILIDPSTRRPTPLPDHWRVHYGPLCVRQQPLVIPKQCPPDSAISDSDQPHHRLTVAWSDTDNNNHTNFTSYIRFALDALYPGLRHGYLGDYLTEAEMMSGVSEVKVAYLGESAEGDVLQVRLWCPLDEKRTVTCSMTKEGGQPVCQVTLTFQQPEGHPS